MSLPVDFSISKYLGVSEGQTVDDYHALLTTGTHFIDLRAPVEFNKGAFPGTVNLPLMNDDERHQVGIRYKQAGRQSAIELGAQLLGEEQRHNRTQQWADFISQHPDSVLYCFRGGLRSRISQRWLLDIGVNRPVVKGGYKGMRSFLIEAMERLCQAFAMVLVGGRTGTGKTQVLKLLPHSIDLEQLAQHRGSSFGGLVDRQPGNIDFENAVAIEMLKLQDARAGTLFLEDEARLIGKVCLPEALRHAMQRAPLFILECGMAQRVENCLQDYVFDLLELYTSRFGDEQGWLRYAEHHRGSLQRIRKRLGGERYKRACLLLEQALKEHESSGDTSAYGDGIELLLKHYYDPMYDYQLSGKQNRVVFSGTADELVARALTH